MKEFSMGFKPAMVRALLAYSPKTQTRRPITARNSLVDGVALTQRKWDQLQLDFSRAELYLDRVLTVPGIVDGVEGSFNITPRFQRGDRIWVKEDYRFTDDLDKYKPAEVGELCVNAGYRRPWAPIQYEADQARDNWSHTGTPPHYRPPAPGKLRAAMFMPRWACRLVQEIHKTRVQWVKDISEDDAFAEGCHPVPGGPSARHLYSELWCEIHGRASWRNNPLVWVLDFHKEQK